jgi:kinesin family protein 3/17
MKFLVRASFLQIYNEVISDLLKPERTNLMIREDKRKGVFVEVCVLCFVSEAKPFVVVSCPGQGLSEWVVRSPQEIYGLMQVGCSRLSACRASDGAACSAARRCARPAARA